MGRTVAVIATVLNEAGAIEALLDSLARQTRRPDEVVIVDGGSHDGTAERLHAWAAGGTLPLRAEVLPGCNISRGRNAAIAATAAEIVVSTDAGVRLEDDWLANLVAPFEGAQPPDVVGGFFVSAPQTLFERVLGATTLPALAEVDAATFAPSSRSVAFRRSAWAALGGYPEWLDYCEDLVFDFGLRDAGYVFVFAPGAVVHFRPRPNLRAFFKQYYRYARGDGKADLWRYRHLVRYATYLVAVPALAALAVWGHPLWWLALLAGQAAMMRGAYRRLAPHLAGLALGERLRALAWVPVIRWAGDVAKMIGYPAGIAWRRQHAPAGPWPRRQW